MSHRLKQYEALLQDQDIDTNALFDNSESESSRTAHTGEAAEHSLQLPTLATTDCEPGESITKTQLLHGQGA